MLPIPEYEDYLITEDGKVFSNKSNRYLALRPNTAGYLRVALSKGGKVREFLVHRLVLNTFLPSSNSEKLHVNHINGVITDNSLSNLEWSTPKENQQRF